MSLRSLALPLLLIGSAAGAVAWLLIAEPPPLPVQVNANDQTADVSISRETDAGHGNGPNSRTDNVPEVPLPSEIRDVSPDGVSAPSITAPLKRIAPSQSYIDSKTLKAEPPADDKLRLKRPTVIAAGTLQTPDLTVRFANIEALAPETTCPTDDGSSWPCGARARTALRGLIRIFSVDCEKVSDIAPREISAVCFRRNADIAAWLIEYGWAVPLRDAPERYHELARQAEENRRGQWRTVWQPVTRGLDETTDIPGPSLEGMLDIDEDALAEGLANPFSEINPAEDGRAPGPARIDLVPLEDLPAAE